MSRAQVSLEYLFIVGLALAIIIPGAYLFYTYSKASTDNLISAEIVRNGNEVLHIGEETWAQGKNSWRTLRVTFPEPVSDFYFVDSSPQELVIEYWTETGLTEAIFFVSGAFRFETSDVFVVDGFPAYRFNVSQGLNSMRFENRGSFVFVS